MLAKLSAKSIAASSLEQNIEPIKAGTIFCNGPIIRSDEIFMSFQGATR
jgi:hypothetical protein